MSKFLKLNVTDVIKGAVVAAFASAVAVVGASIYAGRMPTLIEWKVAGLAASTAAVGYLIKNLLTNSQGQPFKEEPKA